jgi:hypothetical protein
LLTNELTGPFLGPDAEKEGEMGKVTRAMVDALERKVDALEKRDDAQRDVQFDGMMFDDDEPDAIPQTMVCLLKSIVELCHHKRAKIMRTNWAEEGPEDYASGQMHEEFLAHCEAEMKRSLRVWEAALEGAKHSTTPMWPKGLKH